MAAKQKTARKKRRITPYAESTCTVRLTQEVKGDITGRSQYSESIDKTLRRMIKYMPDEEVIEFVKARSRHAESFNETLRRLLRIPRGGNGRP